MAMAWAGRLLKPGLREKVGAGVIRDYGIGVWVDLDASGYLTERVRSPRFGKSRRFHFLNPIDTFLLIVSQSVLRVA